MPRSIILKVKSISNRDEIIEITDLEEQARGKIKWTQNSTVEEYEIEKITKNFQFSCVKFFLKFNHANLRASLFIHTDKFVFTIANSRQVYSAEYDVRQSYKLFLDSFNVPAASNCWGAPYTQKEIEGIMFSPTGVTVSSYPESADDSIRHIELIKKGGQGCGGNPLCGQWEFLRNKTNDKSIRAFIRTDYVYQNNPVVLINQHDAMPNEEVFLGCTKWCPEIEPPQEFKRRILSSKYI